MVLILDPQLPRASWPIGQVSAVTSGRAGRVRSAEVRVGEQTYSRPVSGLIVRPELTDDDG